MAHFSMLIGIPGSGKSTWLKKSSKLVICPDAIRMWLTNDVSDQSQNDVVWKIALYTTIWNLENNFSVVLDATNVNTTLRRSFISQLPQNIEKHAIVFETDPEICIQRIHKDIIDNVTRSQVPPEVIYRMYGEFLYTKQVIKYEKWTTTETIVSFM